MRQPAAMRYRAAWTLALGLVGCAGPSPPPDDSALRRRFANERETYQWLCREFPPSGLSAVGRAAGGLRLAAHGHLWFEPPDDAALTAAGVTRAIYDDYVSALARVGALSIEGAAGGVRIVVHRDGIAPSGSTTWLSCTTRAPAQVVDDCARRTGSHGRHCVALDPSWWICCEWN